MRAPASPTRRLTHRSLAPAHARLAAHDDAIVRAQITVAQIAAPTGEEHERGGWVARRFRDCGLVGHPHRRRRQRRSAVATARANCRRSSSARTSTPSFRATPICRSAARATAWSGPGINDNGRGLAVMLALAGEIDGVRLRPQHPVEFVATTGEEGMGDLRGAKHYFADRGRDAHATIALDGAGDERIIHRALGSRRFRISYSGPGGHSWAAFGVAERRARRGRAPRRDSPRCRCRRRRARRCPSAASAAGCR